MSPRNLTRVFKRATGITLKQYVNRVRLEIAGNLLQSPELSLEQVAERCGFADPRQFRRLWIRSHGVSPSAWRSRRSAFETGPQPDAFEPDGSERSTTQTM